MARGEGLQAASSAGPRPPALVLVEPLGAHTWRGVADGRVPVAARWLAPAASPFGAGPHPAVSSWPIWPADAAVTHRLSEDPTLVPVLGLARTESAHWLLSELDGGVSVRRLLALARLTPLQAVAVLDHVHVALAALHDQGRWHGRVHAGNVHVGGSGRVRVGDWGPALLTPGPLDGHRPADLAAAARLAGELAVAAGVPQHRPGSRQAQLLAAVERRADGRHTDPHQALPALLDADELARATAELATVVQALRRSQRPRVPAPRKPVDPSPSGVLPSDAPSDPPAQSARVPLVTAGPPVLRTPRRRRPSPVLLAAVSLAVLGAAVVAEVALLGPDIRASWQRLTDAPADQGRDPRAVVAGPDVPVLAPAAAGPVTRVAVRPLRACEPGQVCDLRVLVQVWPDDERRLPVAWTIAVVDTCTGERSVHPGGAARVPVGADRVDGLTHVRLPAGRSLALVAVTHQPARAASAPLLVPPRAGPC